MTPSNNYGIGMAANGEGERFVLLEIETGGHPQYRLEKRVGKAVAFNVPVPVYGDSAPRITCGATGGHVYVAGPTAAGVHTLFQFDKDGGRILWQLDFPGCNTRYPAAVSAVAGGSAVYIATNYGRFADHQVLETGSPAMVVDTKNLCVDSPATPLGSTCSTSRPTSATRYMGRAYRGSGLGGTDPCEKYGEAVVMKFDHAGGYQWGKQNHNADIHSRNLVAPTAYQVETDAAGDCYVLVNQAPGISQYAEDTSHRWLMARSGSTARCATASWSVDSATRSTPGWRLRIQRHQAGRWRRRLGVRRLH